MRWEELTSDEFAKAVIDCKRTCVFPIGVLERHGPHLPLGTDIINAHYIATEAAKREPAIVFPYWFLGKIFTARCFAGTIAIEPKLLLEITLEILDEIGRNGFRKIIIYNGHGGNRDILSYVLRSQLYKKKSYSLYMLFYDDGLTEEERKKLAELWDAPWGEHAHESETSLTMAHRPDLVKMDALKGKVAEPTGRLDHLKPGQTSWDFYANFPDHYAGDARKASPVKGKVFLEMMINSLARFIRAVKEDTAVEQIAEEFFGREQELRGNSYKR